MRGTHRDTVTSQIRTIQDPVQIGLIVAAGRYDVVVEAPLGGGAGTAPVTGEISVEAADVSCGTPAKVPSPQYPNRWFCSRGAHSAAALAAGLFETSTLRVLDGSDRD